MMNIYEESTINFWICVINKNIDGFYAVYISYVIDASRGVPKVITDRTHTRKIADN
jgi:hypothetical protein